MGFSGYDEDAFKSRSSVRAATGATAFVHDKAARAGRASALNDKMNPLGVTRESRDSEKNPESTPVVILLDVTGSLTSVPKTVVEKLTNLLNLLTKEAWLEYPHILISAFGDATCDRVPLQVGQFESDIAIDDDLGRIYLEGGGGGQKTESSELGLYWIARHTKTDAWDKRQKKGYVFVISDELSYSSVKSREVKSIIGDDIQDIPTASIVEELQEKWNVYYILPAMTSYYDDPAILKFWRNLLGENVVKLQDPESVCELIASLIAANEGTSHDDITSTLTRAGVSSSAVASLSKSIAVIEPKVKGSLPSTGKSRGVVKV